MIKNLKLFIYFYFWFWKESFSFMKGTNRIVIAWGCFRKAPTFAKEQVRWENLTAEMREYEYLHMDRTVEF